MELYEGSALDWSKSDTCQPEPNSDNPPPLLNSGSKAPEPTKLNEPEKDRNSGTAGTAREGKKPLPKLYLSYFRFRVQGRWGLGLV